MIFSPDIGIRRYGKDIECSNDSGYGDYIGKVLFHFSCLSKERCFGYNNGIVGYFKNLSKHNITNMRIGIDARMYGPKLSGIGNYVKNLSQNLFSIDLENEYVLFFLDEEFEKFQPPNSRIKKILVSARWYTMKEQVFLWRQFEKHKTDIMHFPNFNVPLFFTRKFITTIHDMTPWKFPGHKVQASHLRRFAYDIVFNSAVKRSEKILTVSEHSRQEIIKKYPLAKDKICVIYNGISKTFQRCHDYGIIQALKDKYGIKKPFIFFVGVWRNHKNIPNLLRAYKYLRETYSIDIDIVLGGDGATNPDPKIAETIRELGLECDIIKTGFISENELPIFYSAAALTVIPSFIEGFGLHAIESLSCETPVAASKTTSIPEILGKNALYFDPYNHKEMADVIQRLLANADFSKKLAEKGKEAIKKYSWEKCARETLNIYNSFKP